MTPISQESQSVQRQQRFSALSGLRFHRQISKTRPLETSLIGLLSLAHLAQVRAPESSILLPLRKQPGCIPTIPILKLAPRHSPLTIAFKSFLFTFFRTLLHSSKTQPFCFQSVPHSFTKTPGVGVPN